MNRLIVIALLFGSLSSHALIRRDFDNAIEKVVRANGQIELDLAIAEVERLQRQDPRMAKEASTDALLKFIRLGPPRHTTKNGMSYGKFPEQIVQLLLSCGADFDEAFALFLQSGCRWGYGFRDLGMEFSWQFVQAGADLTRIITVFHELLRNLLRERDVLVSRSGMGGGAAAAAASDDAPARRMFALKDIRSRLSGEITFDLMKKNRVDDVEFYSSRLTSNQICRSVFEATARGYKDCLRVLASGGAPLNTPPIDLPSPLDNLLNRMFQHFVEGASRQIIGLKQDIEIVSVIFAYADFAALQADIIASGFLPKFANFMTHPHARHVSPECENELLWLFVQVGIVAEISEVVPQEFRDLKAAMHRVNGTHLISDGELVLPRPLTQLVLRLGGAPKRLILSLQEARKHFGGAGR